jgi:hypothetical protein
MPGLDEEVVERARRWCAEAGREATPTDVRAALDRLSWDELLAAKALLADPPPARPLGPFALADIARGAPPDLAADRERSGRYRPEAELERAPAAAPAPARPAGPTALPGRRPARPAVVVRRARDRAPPAPEVPPPLPALETLRAPAGRAVLERLLRRHGARRAALAAALAERWRRADGLPPGEGDLDALLDHHGLLRAFSRRERDEALHALRAAGGLRTRAAARLGLDPAGLDAALERLGAAAEAERIRDQRRADLRARATLAERASLVLREGERLDDLGLREELERDLGERLPDHLRALAAGPGPIPARLATSLGLSRAEALHLAARFGVDLGAPGAGPSRGSGGRSPRAGPPRPGRPPGAARRGAQTGARPGARPGGPRAGPPRRGGSRRRPPARRPL